MLLAGGWAEVVQVWSPGEVEAAVGVALTAGIVAAAVVALWEGLSPGRCASPSTSTRCSTASGVRATCSSEAAHGTHEYYAWRAEPAGNNVPSVLGRRYDALCYFDQTRALHPLHREPPQARRGAGGQPFGS